MDQLLLVEDDAKIAREIEEQLEQGHYSVTTIKSIAQAKLLDTSLFKLIILDWNLPDGNGIEIVTDIRRKGIQTPILMLTANTEPKYRKIASESGVNDFLGKPFYFHELLSRIEILLKDKKKTGDGIIKSSGIEVIKNEMRVIYKENEVTLTKKEFELLVFFLSNQNTVFSRNEILDSVWGEDENPSPRTVDTHVLHLRKKFASDLFKTVWSSGYRYVPIKED